MIRMYNITVKQVHQVESKKRKQPYEPSHEHLKGSFLHFS